MTVTVPALRLRWTVPVSHQVRLRCQLHGRPAGVGASRNTHQIV